MMRLTVPATNRTRFNVGNKRMRLAEIVTTSAELRAMIDAGRDVRSVPPVLSETRFHMVRVRKDGTDYADGHGSEVLYPTEHDGSTVAQFVDAIMHHGVFTECDVVDTPDGAVVLPPTANLDMLRKRRAPMGYRTADRSSRAELDACGTRPYASRFDEVRNDLDHALCVVERMRENGVSLETAFLEEVTDIMTRNHGILGVARELRDAFTPPKR